MSIARGAVVFRPISSATARFDSARSRIEDAGCWFVPRAPVPAARYVVGDPRSIGAAGGWINAASPSCSVMTLAGARPQDPQPGERREGVYPVGNEIEFPAWVAFSLFVTFALVGAVAAGGVAHENGRRWWIWAPLGALFAVGPQVFVPLLEGTPLYRDSPITTLHGVIAVTCAAWCGYLARSKQRRVWLWIVLGAGLRLHRADHRRRVAGKR